MSRPGSACWAGHSPLELARVLDAPFVEAYEVLGSTNDRAVVLAAEGAPLGTVVVANEQTAGRGRRGAAWWSARGAGLWMSTLLKLRGDGAALPLLVGLACAEGIEACADGVTVHIKWPNDLLIRGRKVGGVLCEAVDDTLVAGFGVNTSTPKEGFPPDLVAAATSLEDEISKSLDRTDLARAILARLRSRAGMESPMSDALQEVSRRDALRGNDVLTDQDGPGLAVGIDQTGALVMERSDGSRVRIISGGVRIVDSAS